MTCPAPSEGRDDCIAATTTESRWVLWAAAKILRHVANEDTSRSQNDAAELRNAAAVCEGVANRG